MIEGVTHFKYLGRILEETDSKWTVVHRTISKARAVWRRLGNMLQREGADS